MKKSMFLTAFSVVCAILSVVTGGGALMAVAGSTLGTSDGNSGTQEVYATEGGEGAVGANKNGGKLAEGATDPYYNNENLHGVPSQTENGRMNADGEDGSNLDSRALSKTIRELQPMKTPFDTLTRYATSGEKPEGMKFEYASIGSRPTMTTTTANFSITGTAMSAKITLTDPQMVSVDDVLIFPEYLAVTDGKGNAYASAYGTDYSNGAWPCLMVKVCGFDDSDSQPVVYALNGNKNTNGQAILVNSLHTVGAAAAEVAKTAVGSGAKVLRLAKAVNEGAAQTGRTAELPKTDYQYLQIFMTQAEESTIHKLTKRDVNGLDLAWHERRTLEDFKMVQEGTFMFSDKTLTKSHPKENLNKVWTTGGVWYMAGKDVTLGHVNAVTEELEIFDDDLVDVDNEIFVGEGTGGKKKIWICGSNFVSALEKVKSDKFRLKGDVQAWDLTFNSWKTNFGESLVIHSETMDKYGKKNWAFSLDPDYFEKRVLYSLDRNVIDLEKMGVRATQAVVLKEVSAVVLYAPQAHARIKLAGQAAVAF